jgi:hypothetical protein
MFDEVAQKLLNIEAQKLQSIYQLNEKEGELIFDKIEFSAFWFFLKITKQEYSEGYYFNYIVEKYEEPKTLADLEKKDTWISILKKGGNITKKLGVKRKLDFLSTIKTEK